MAEEGIKALSLGTLTTIVTDDCEAAEEAITTDSEEYSFDPLRAQSTLQYSISSTNSSATVTPQCRISIDNNSCYSFNNEINYGDIEIPIIGYEVMEERARFTAFKLKIINKSTGSYWFVFRRYTDFVRLCNKLKPKYPHISQYLPRKRWIGNNFEPIFLEERINCLQTLVNAILSEADILKSSDIQDFFCLSEPPLIAEGNEESQVIFEALEDTVHELKKQVEEKEKTIDNLQDTLHSKVLENENLKRIIRNSTLNCQKCHKEYTNISKALNTVPDTQNIISHSLPR